MKNELTQKSSAPDPCNIDNTTHNVASSLASLQVNESFPTLFVISPTHARLTQKSDLTAVCITLTHVPNLVWIVVEDSDHLSDLVKRLLQRCKVKSVHLNAVTPEYYKDDKWKPRGVLQRNTGLKWIRDHHSTKDCNGIVYFGDDDNSYDLRLFEEVLFHSLILRLSPPCVRD